MRGFKPLISHFNELVSGLASGSGRSLHCVRQTRRMAKNQEFVCNSYQLSLFFYGALQTRENDWHDLFNALVWKAFPQSKAAHNLQYFLCLEKRMDFPWEPIKGNRTAQEDALTLFDEGGMICVTLDDDLWNRVLGEDGTFFHLPQVRFFLFGHGIMDSVRMGQSEITTACVRIRIDPSGKNDDDLVTLVDHELAKLIHECKGFELRHVLNGVPLKKGFCF